MGTNSLTVTGRPRRFGKTQSGMVRRSAPVSPMVIQHFTQLLSDLSQKVNALAVNQEKVIAARNADIVPMAKPVESTEVEVKPLHSSQPDSQRRAKVNRNKAREIFD